jgi:hypothetical protein
MVEYGPLFGGWTEPLDPPFGGWFTTPPTDWTLPDFPEALHVWLDLLALSGTPLVESHPPHTAIHQKIENELTATQAKLGYGASTPTLGKVLTGLTTAGTSGWADIPAPAAPDVPYFDVGQVSLATSVSGDTDVSVAWSNYAGEVAPFYVFPLVPTGQPIHVSISAWDKDGATFSWWMIGGANLMEATTANIVGIWLVI